jgi:hypothetical protein
MESTEYLDMTSVRVFAHCTVEEGKLILDRILSVTPLEDLQFKASLISEDESIITYLNISYISALPAKEELLELTKPEIGSKTKLKTPLHFPCQSKKIDSMMTLGTRQRLLLVTLRVSYSTLLEKTWRNS